MGGWAGATLGDENHTCTPGALLCSALQRKAVIEALSRSAGSGDGIYQNFGEHVPSTKQRHKSSATTSRTLLRPLWRTLAPPPP